MAKKTITKARKGTKATNGRKPVKTAAQVAKFDAELAGEPAVDGGARVVDDQEARLLHITGSAAEHDCELVGARPVYLGAPRTAGKRRTNVRLFWRDPRYCGGATSPLIRPASRAQPVFIGLTIEHRAILGRLFRPPHWGFDELRRLTHAGERGHPRHVYRPFRPYTRRLIPLVFQSVSAYLTTTGPGHIATPTTEKTPTDERQ
jgi:hypothetical protein